MPRRASTYHDTEKANSGELDNSGGFVSGADIIRREEAYSRGRRRRHVEASQRRRRCIRLCSMTFFAQVDGEE